MSSLSARTDALAQCWKVTASPYSHLSEFGGTEARPRRVAEHDDNRNDGCSNESEFEFEINLGSALSDELLGTMFVVESCLCVDFYDGATVYDSYVEYLEQDTGPHSLCVLLPSIPSVHGLLSALINSCQFLSARQQYKFLDHRCCRS